MATAAVTIQRSSAGGVLAGPSSTVTNEITWEDAGQYTVVTGRLQFRVPDATVGRGISCLINGVEEYRRSGVLDVGNAIILRMPDARHTREVVYVRAERTRPDDGVASETTSLLQRHDENLQTHLVDGCRWTGKCLIVLLVLLGGWKVFKWLAENYPEVLSLIVDIPVWVAVPTSVLLFGCTVWIARGLVADSILRCVSRLCPGLRSLFRLLRLFDQ